MGNFGPLTRAFLYLSHFLRSGNEHSVHSPSVYKLYCDLRAKGQPDSKIVALRRRLEADKTLISFQDPGNDFKVKTTSISKLTKVSAKKDSLGLLLHRLVKVVQPSNCLELGTSLGLSAIYQHSAVPQSEFTTVEGAEEIARLAKNNISEFGLKTQVRHSTFEDFLKTKTANTFYDYVYLDGHHQFEPTLEYFKQLKKMVKPSAMIVLDDIYWSKGMMKAWQKIQQDPEVAISIDLFHFGILMFRDGVEKQHFSLRMKP